MSDGAAGITNATAIGAFSQVTESNALVLGSISGINSANEDTYVGIGTTNPDRQLVVEGEQALIRFTRYYSDAIHAPALLMEHSRGTRSAPADMVPGDYLGKVQFRGRVSGNMPEYGVFAFVASDLNQNGRFSFIDRDLTTERVSILNTGNMGIGTTTPTERLHVVGNIKVTGNVLAGASENIPDYVFEPDYKLMSLKQLGSFITQEKHLPNIPSALEMKDKDVNLNEFQMKLLEKIEELTLYVVQQSKEIESQTKIIKTKDAEITNLKSKSSDLDSRLSELEQLLKK
jgi:hypothetical protein